MMGVKRNLGSRAFQWLSPSIVPKVQTGVIGSRAFHELVPEGRVAEAFRTQRYLVTNGEHYFFYHFHTFLKVCIMVPRFCVLIIFYFDFYGHLFTVLLISFRFPWIL